MIKVMVIEYIWASLDVLLIVGPGHLVNFTAIMFNIIIQV